MSVRVETIDAARVLTIDRPETRNAIDRTLAQTIASAVRSAALDPEVRGIVITGTGGTFLSGGDLKMLAELTENEHGSSAVLSMFDDLAAGERCDLPVVAAIQGDVFGGGCEFVLLCDLVIIEEQASLAFVHAKMGLSPAWGGLTRLIERVGPIEAARILFTAEKIDAASALRIGLVNEVVSRGSACTRALARIARIAENPRTTVAAMKRTLREVREQLRGDAIDCERKAFAERWGTADHREAMRAFLKK